MDTTGQSRFVILRLHFQTSNLVFHFDLREFAPKPLDGQLGASLRLRLTAAAIQITNKGGQIFLGSHLRQIDFFLFFYKRFIDHICSKFSAVRNLISECHFDLRGFRYFVSTVACVPLRTTAAWFGSCRCNWCSSSGPDSTDNGLKYTCLNIQTAVFYSLPQNFSCRLGWY